MDADSEAKRVADEILGRIVRGAYPAGLRLPAETDLAETLSCGRSTVREALSHLASLGVVKSRRGSGAMVLDFRREGTPGLLPAYVLAGRFDRPAGVLARELLGLRTLLAVEAVRLAARYAEPAALVEARAILARAPGLAKDPAAHARNELDLFRALVIGSGIWPAVWLSNVFWPPMRELQDSLAGAVGKVPRDYQRQMTLLLDLIDEGEAARAAEHVRAWFERVDGLLVAELEQLLGAAAGDLAAPPREASPAARRPTPSLAPVPAKKRPQAPKLRRKAVKR
jgi:DNA-binding FadR family transcriptional regulator